MYIRRKHLQFVRIHTTTTDELITLQQHVMCKIVHNIRTLADVIGSARKSTTDRSKIINNEINSRKREGRASTG